MTFLGSNFARLKVLSYLSGTELFHKIALLNKRTRSLLPSCGLLDQEKILTVAPIEKDADYIALLHESNLKYAIKFADGFAIRITSASFEKVLMQIAILKTHVYLQWITS